MEIDKNVKTIVLNQQDRQIHLSKFFLYQKSRFLHWKCAYILIVINVFGNIFKFILLCLFVLKSTSEGSYKMI